MFLKSSLGQLLRLFPDDWRRRLGVNLGALDLQWSLMQLRRFGFVPKSALDVGAFHGDWTRVCLDVFPEATITCIEPQNACQKYLRTLASQRRNVRIFQALLGESESDAVPYIEMGPGSSVLSGGDRVASFVPMSTIDALIRGGQCEPPELIKLDVQGYEIHVLEGWKKGFDRCQVIQIEISLLPIVSGAPLLDEVITYLGKRGFVMFDIEELVHSPSDGAVWQIDALFCGLNSPIRTQRVWRNNT